MPRQLIIILLVALVLILMTVQNPNPVSVQFLSWQAEQVPVIIIILISLLTGVFVSAVSSLIKQSKLKDKIHRLEREIDDLKYPLESSSDEDEKKLKGDMENA